MTYRSLKNFINKNSQKHNSKIFDLISKDIKSKIILIVGNRTCNVASFLCSIMSACEISHTHYINTNRVDFNKRFLHNELPINQEIICENAEKLLKITKKSLSNDDLFLAITLSISSDEYTVIEMSEEYYNHAKEYISPFALILSIQEDEKVASLIKNAPNSIKEIISLSNKENFDYISNKTNDKGARITLASANKITIANANLLGTSFYHYSYLYHISALDLNNISLAHLAIESANVLFSAPRPYIYKGLDSARPILEFELYSLSPTVLVWNGEDEFSLHHKVQSKIDEIK